MAYGIAIACLIGWVATTCIFAWVFLKVQQRHSEERAAEHRLHRQEIAHAARALLEQVQSHQIQIDALGTSHREEIAALNQARIEEVAGLLQRIQAPEQAATDHSIANAPADPPPLDYENDEQLLAAAQSRMDEFYGDLEARIQ